MATFSPPASTGTLNLDTHILIHALSGNLRPTERSLLSANHWGISPVVLWEIAKLAQIGRIALDVDSPTFIRAMRKIHLWPMTLDVAHAVKMLDFRSDPIDEIIAATSIAYEIPLITRDRKIRASRIVRCAP